MYKRQHLYYAFGQLDSAINTYSEYLQYPDADSDLAAAALLGIAACLEEKSQYDRAIDFYYKVLKEYPEYFRADEAYVGMARCYDIKGDMKRAFELYRDFYKKFPDSPLTSRVTMMLARLEAKTTPLSSPGTTKPKGETEKAQG